MLVDNGVDVPALLEKVGIAADSKAETAGNSWALFSIEMIHAVSVVGI